MTRLIQNLSSRGYRNQSSLNPKEEAEVMKGREPIEHARVEAKTVGVSRLISSMDFKWIEFYGYPKLLLFIFKDDMIICNKNKTINFYN